MLEYQPMSGLVPWPLLPIEEKQIHSKIPFSQAIKINNNTDNIEWTKIALTS